jgi:hypothetical protein
VGAPASPGLVFIKDPRRDLRGRPLQAEPGRPQRAVGIAAPLGYPDGSWGAFPNHLLAPHQEPTPIPTCSGDSPVETKGITEFQELCPGQIQARFGLIRPMLPMLSLVLRL